MVEFSYIHDRIGYQVTIIEMVVNGVDILTIERPDSLIKDTVDFIINSLSSE